MFDIWFRGGSDRREGEEYGGNILTPSVVPHAVGGRTQAVTHGILRDLGDPYTSEYLAPQCLADVEA